MILKRINYFICLALMVNPSALLAQQIPNWQHQDLATDGNFGISTAKAYALLKDKPSKPVVVAVIDAGVDTLHEDLQGVLWTNPKKRKGDNGTYGWSYIGSAKGNVHYDNLELVRLIRAYQGDTTAASYVALKQDLQQRLTAARRELSGLQGFATVLRGITDKLGKPSPTLAELRSFQPNGPAEKQVAGTLINILSNQDDFAKFKTEQIDRGLEHYRHLIDYQLNVAYDPRAQYVSDDYPDTKQRDYGSPDNMGPDATHGTHVSGIIAAVRNNGIGLDGIADQVKVLNIRAVPDGDERDKDIANAIRYAADHGAKIINISFGKSYSSAKPAVDDAVRYALKKDVLLVQAAGNDNHNIDSLPNFPDRKNVTGAWLVVGASGLQDDGQLRAPFSNYGKTAVDVFAPGVQIYSTVPGSKYAYFDGTSMAAPVVSGLVALIRSYYPKLRAAQVKDIILRSVVKREALRNYCQTGGVVNAYQALLLAAQY